MTTKKNNNRAYGIDLIKIIACIMIVGLHTLRPGRGPLVRALFYTCYMGIPLFFMSSGYTLFMKSEVSWKYVFKKIGKILFVCFCWEALHALAYFLYYHEFRNFIESFFLDFIQKGLFFQFWFLGSLIIIYLLLPLLYRLMKENPTLFKRITIILGCICIAVDVVSVFLAKGITLTNTFCMWSWLFFFMLGAEVSVNKFWFSEKVLSCTFVQKLFAILFSISLMISWIWFCNIYRGMGWFYGSFPNVLACLMLFIVLGICVNESNKLLEHITPITMGIYIVHPFILAVLVKFVPDFVNGGGLMNLIYFTTTILISSLASWCISKIPLLKQLIRI